MTNPLGITDDRRRVFEEMVEGVTSERGLSSKLDEQKTISIFHPIKLSDLLEMPSKLWLVDQIFGAGDIGMIYGQPGSGKTFVIIDMIMSVCTGIQWASKFGVFRSLNVAYCAGEGIGGLPSRFNAAAKHYEITFLQNLTFYSTPPQLFEDGTEATIKQFCEEWKTRQAAAQTIALDLLIIDTLHTATVGADENSAQQMGKVLHSCRWIAKELGCAVMLVHHSNKTGTTERGSSALRGAMDFMIKIENASDAANHGIMSCEKLKDGEKWKEQSFNLCPQEGLESVYVSWNPQERFARSIGSKVLDKQALKTEMQRYAGRKFTCKTLAESIAKTESYTRKLLNELEKAKECNRAVSNPEKPQSNRNSWVYWIDVAQRRVDSGD